MMCQDVQIADATVMSKLSASTSIAQRAIVPLDCDCRDTLTAGLLLLAFVAGDGLHDRDRYLAA